MLTSIYNSKLLGEGPYVKLFDVENDTMQCRLLVLPGRRIHGICLSTTCSAGNLMTLALFVCIFVNLGMFLLMNFKVAIM